jgi:bifunctional non-homologous end joining protein LigD
VAVQGKPIQIGRHEVKITHPGKILFPEDGLTNQDLIDYYCRITPWILPHLRGRPLAMERYPDGIDKPGFFQKATPFYYPAWIKTVTVKKVGGSVQHVVCDDAATLVYLAD